MHLSKKQLTFLVLAGLGVAFGAGAWFAQPYLGFLPLLRKPPIDLGDVLPTPGKNETGLPLELPQGFSMSVFAKDLENPRVVIEAPNRTLLVSVPTEGKVVTLTDADGDGQAEGSVLIQGLERPHGLALDAQGSLLYVAESNALSVYTYDPDKRTATGRKKLADLPDDGRHWSKTLLPFDGDLLVSIGSSCDVCHEEDARRGSVQLFDLQASALAPYAVGLRNAVFLTMGPDQKVWATEMGRDFLGDNLPPDEINIIEKEKNYGWPNCYGKNIHDTVFDKNTYIRNPCMEPFETQSLIDLPAHSAPLGLAFVPSGKGWPKEYEGNVLVAYHGSWNRTVPTGYAIRRFFLDSKNNVVKDEDFVSGWLTEKGVLGRPADLKFASEGTLYVSDDRAGLIYRITPPR